MDNIIRKKRALASNEGFVWCALMKLIGLSKKIVIIPTLDKSQVNCNHTSFYIQNYDIWKFWELSFLDYNIPNTFSQVVDTLSPLCKSANMNDTIRLANELHHFLDWDQIESEVSCKKIIT